MLCWTVGDNCTTSNDEAGECRILKNCPVLLEQVRDSEVSSSTLLNEHKCGFDGLDLLVCCPELSSRRPVWDNPRERNRNKTSSSGTRPTSGQGGGSVRREQCGKNTILAIGDRIVGGTDASLGMLWLFISSAKQI